MLLGEFGVYKLRSDALSRANWLLDVRRIAEGLGWGWCVWEVHKGFGILSGDLWEPGAERALFDAPSPIPSTTSTITPVSGSGYASTAASGPPCELHLSWESVVSAYAAGRRVVSGGLGGSMTEDYGVWLCVERAMANCTSQDDSKDAAAAAFTGGGDEGSLPCFRYHEGLERFEYWGRNRDLRLV